MDGKRQHYLCLVITVMWLCSHVGKANTCTQKRKALDDYVAKPDREYSYVKVNQHHAEGATIHVYNMTSQKWLHGNDSSRSVWWHYLSIIIPNNYNPAYQNYSFLHAGTDSNTDDEPDPDIDFMFDLMIEYAVNMGMATAYLQQVPNQPIIFFSVTRAMDTVQSLVGTLSPGVHVQHFFLNGVSKRGWASLLAGAVDARVVGIAPMVYSMLDMQQNFHQHYRALGGYSFAMAPYHEENIMRLLDTEQWKAAASHLDPWEYRDRLTMPKLFISATGDSFFLNQDSHIWFKNMTPPTYFLMLENTGHSMFPHYLRAWGTVIAFIKATVQGTPMPKMSWDFSETNHGGKIRLTIDMRPSEIKAWAANTSDAIRRDWRLTRLGKGGQQEPNNITWFMGSVTDLGGNVYEVEYHNPMDGRWIAFHIEASFAGPEAETFTFTSEVNISPDTLPFADCSGQGCHGNLV